MQEHESGTIRNDLLERLRSLEGPGSTGSLAELSDRRAKEALERALEEARNIRLQALDDARITRERESSALVASLRQLRDDAEAQIDALLRTAEIESERMRHNAASEAQAIVEKANAEAALSRAEATAIRNAAEERVKEVERVEAEFNQSLGDIALRLGLKEKPAGWWRNPK